MAYSDITAIIPTLNEAENIEETVTIITAKYKGIRVMVADDGSTDSTGIIAKRIAQRNANVKLLDRRREKAHGITASIIDAATKAKTSYIIVIDGDLQHPPEKIGEIAGKLREGKDIVVGTRKAVIGGWPLNRRLMSWIATNLARMRLGRRVSDPMSGFFGAKRELFTSAAEKNGRRFVKEGYKVLFDLLKCTPKASLAEVSYNFGERKRGKSKIRARHVMHFLKSLIR